MIRAIVAGTAGRMGGRIIKTIMETDGIELAASFERPDHPAVGKDVGEIVGAGPLGITVASGLEDVIDDGDVIIDFTHYEASLRHLEIAAKRQRPIVIGSTGFTESHLAEVRRYAENIPCVLAPNMSVGVNVLFKIVAEVAKYLGDGFDIEIIEAHHHHKKDAPSGTAMKLAEVLAEARGWQLSEVGVFCRHGMIGERKKEEIGIQTIRAGDIAGEHTVLFGGIGERIEVIHKAYSRDNFARGAVRAALWIVNQPNGLYDMQDVLGLK
ncbi:MAG: 4-hydroxy-tetrahydrodipicolinate reductase [Deltaproteobacteria bacterium]|nr:MAG: 4-hydroxy-tetrahydrodipicolinate reductase [Deltaproteobacteria bacterium]